MRAAEVAIKHAESLGREHKPLELARYARILVLRVDPVSGALVIELVSGKTLLVACAAIVDDGARPTVTDDHLAHGKVRFGFHRDERPKIDAWLAGFYGDAA